MARWHDALRTYRRTSLEGDLEKEPRSVMFVLCSENHAAAALVAACEPALVLQTLGGARNAGDESTRATFEYAIRKMGVRHVVVCGHEGCQGIDTAAEANLVRFTRESLVSQCGRLLADGHIGPLLQEYRVSLRPIWFDVPEGDVFLCNLENERATLMGDDGFAKMLEAFSSDPR